MRVTVWKRNVRYEILKLVEWKPITRQHKEISNSMKPTYADEHVVNCGSQVELLSLQMSQLALQMMLRRKTIKKKGTGEIW